MTLGTIMMIALALSIDAWTVSLSCGLKMQKVIFKNYLKIAFAFGFFQALMPMLGWLIGIGIRDYISAWGNPIAGTVFGILALKSFHEGCTSSQEAPKACLCQNKRCLLALAIATSIDAMVVGGLFAIHGTPIVFPMTIIGLTTGIGTLISLWFGHLGSRFFQKSGPFMGSLLLLILSIKSFIS